MFTLSRYFHEVNLLNAQHVLVLEDASLELIPKKFHSHKSCRIVFDRFGIPPWKQILDDNFHHEILKDTNESTKRGRPDIVHFALLDVTSTPLYLEGMIQVVIHTIGNMTIKLKSGVRVPRTTQRFCGVISKLLSNDLPRENSLFEVIRWSNILELFSSLGSARIILLSRVGKLTRLKDFIEGEKSLEREKRVIWVVGGFPHGHFDENLVGISDDTISISKRPLAAHVVTARLSYDLESKMRIN